MSKIELVGRVVLACIVACILLVVSACSPSTECGDFPLTEEVRHCIVERVDHMVMTYYPFAEQKGVDLREFRSELQSLLEFEWDDETFLRELAISITMLRDGHTRLERRFLEHEQRTLPVEYVAIEDAIYVSSVLDPQVPIQPGDRIETINGVSASKVLWQMPTFYGARAHEKSKSIHGRAYFPVNSSGRTHLVVEGRGEVALSGEESLPPHLRKPASMRFGDIGYLDVSTFGFLDDLDRLDRHINNLMDTSALIIDLRGNGGGFPSVTDGLFGRLISHAVPEFQMVGINGDVARSLGPVPRGKTYDKPVVVLTNPRVFSAANYFAQLVDYHNRGLLIGERTGGGAASPDKGVMLVPGVWFQVSTYVIITPEGENTEEGIEPHMRVTLTSEELIEGRGSQLGVPQFDKVLDTAIQYLEGMQ